MREPAVTLVKSHYTAYYEIVVCAVAFTHTFVLGTIFILFVLLICFEDCTTDCDAVLYSDD